ncbi:zinc finger CCCH domain-containing protein ZFN-like isoform X1 [Lactuca sativa]|uniref:zinc finger CCCH domain-containing protein ZFN-like isoform X1 n=1 Tax=Lactuca sativa TaxID=4236 RepID=UPI000CD8DB85|nr:zinc finger CCCH domain-containing protein ZFN-like isoform X1 [Lactuca sativa]
MEFDSGIPMSRPPVTAEVSSSLSPPLNEVYDGISDALWQLNLRSRESMESGPYPVREGEPDCSYYIRTGLCRFGATCRFNHPPNRKLAIATAKMRGEYPERPGQPECQYYLKTGTCKFGATCKFHHPREKAGIAGQVSLNVLGYPLRPNEAECAYYLRTGQCKFGNTCKFHHPQPSNMMVAFSGSPVYPAVQSPTSPGQQWSLTRASFVPSPRWQPPSNYAQMILPQGVVSVPGWNAYRGSMGSLSSIDSQHQHQHQAATGGNQGYYALERENVFPERPGQPDCQFYIKTGDCKFGAVCRFHHPRERVIPMPDCVLSPIGLPLRRGEPLCIFYSRYGICKFGPSCKFDHPMGVFTYNLSPNSSDRQHNMLASASGGSGVLNITSQGNMEGVSVTLSERIQMPSNDNSIDHQE